MKAHKLTGGEAYNFGQGVDLHQRYVGAEKYEKLTFESWGEDGIIIARDEMDCAVILRENRTYTLYTKF